MSKIIYYVASSIDGFIAGENDDISGFIQNGKGVEKYQADLINFDTVIMGRRTYEFGFQFGLKPGQPVYPNMEHYIFSDSLRIDHLAEAVHIERRSIERIKEIKANAKTDIYLCGGGEFAGWLLNNGLIDQLKLKLNPIIINKGVRLFANATKQSKWKLLKTEVFEDGFQIITYEN